MSVPDPPVIYEQAAGLLNQIQFWWEKPLSDGGSPILNYTLNCPALAFSQEFNNSSFTGIVPVHNSIDYLFNITATNAFGTSTPAFYDIASAGSAPDCISSISVRRISSYFARIDWNFLTIPNQQVLHSFIVYAIPSTIGISTLRFYEYPWVSSFNFYGYRSSYAFMVQAVGTGALWSEERPSTAVFSMGEPPTPITDVILVTKTDTDVNISWSGGLGAVNYIFTVVPDDGSGPFTLTPTPVVVGNTTTFTGCIGWRNYSSGPLYNVIITAISSDGGTTENSDLFIRFGPFPASSLTYSSITSSSFTLLWQAANNASSFKFSLDSGSTFVYNSWSPNPYGSSSSGSSVFSGLGIGSTFSGVVVYAVNYESTIAVPSKKPYSTLTLLPGDITDLTASLISQSSFTLNWSGATGASSIVYSGSIQPTTTNGIVGPAVYSGLNTGTYYSSILTPVNRTGIVGIGANTIIKTVPANVTGITQSSGFYSTLNISWSGVFGAEYYKYIIGSSLSAVAISSSVNSITIGGLSSNTAYSTAIVAYGTTWSTYIGSSISNYVNLTTGPPLPDIAITSTSISTFIVTWTEIGGVIYSLDGSLNQNNVTSPLTISSVGQNSTYTYILTATNVYGIAPSSFVIDTIFEVPFNHPGLVGDTAQWFDATDPLNTGILPANSATISKWYDKSGNINNLRQYNSFSLPTLSTFALNSLPTVNFINSSGLTSAAFTKSSNVTMLIVGVLKGGIQNRATFWGHYNTNNRDVDIQLRNFGTLMTWHTNNQNAIGTTYLANSPFMYSCTMSGGTNMFIQQTNTSGTTSQTHTESLTWTAGSAPTFVGMQDDGNFTNSYICEIVYYQTVLSTLDRQKVEGYLAWKWGLSSYLPPDHPYFSTPPFSLPVAPRVPVINSVPQALTSNSLNVAWSSNPPASTFTFMYSLNSDAITGGISTIVNGTVTSADMTGLTPGVTYYTKVIAINSISSVNSAVQSFMTAPTAAINLSTNGVTNSQFTLNWSGATGASSLIVDYGSLSTVTSIIPSPITITNLLPNTVYDVYIESVNLVSTVSSAHISVTTGPGAARNLSTSNISNQFLLYWSGAEGASSLTFHYGTTTIVSSASVVSPILISNLSSLTVYDVYIETKNPIYTATSEHITVSTTKFDIWDWKIAVSTFVRPGGFYPNNVNDITISSDGSKIYAVDGKLKHTSINYGTSWASNNGISSVSIASSADGAKMVSFANTGSSDPTYGLYTSTDYGESWTVRLTNVVGSILTGTIRNLASSADGNILYGVGYPSKILVSINSGESWTENNIRSNYFDIATSADGSKAIASEAFDLWTSTDYGQTWTQRLTRPRTGNIYTAVASSADGSKLIAAVDQENLWISTDYGETWTERIVDNTIINFWQAIASSADGSRLVASGGIFNNNSKIYTSSDYGVTWTSSNISQRWFKIATSANGKIIVAGGANPINVPASVNNYLYIGNVIE